MKYDIPLTLIQWENVLRNRRTIDPATVAYAERRIQELEQREEAMGVGAVMDNFYARRFMKRR